MRQPAQHNTTPDERIEVAAGRRAPYTQLGDWVALSGVDDHAKALYWHLSMHLNIERGDGEVWPSRETLAEWCGFTKTSSVDRYLAQLVEIGAVEVRTCRYANRMRTRNRYLVHQSPPPGYTEPTTLAEYYERRNRDSPGSPSQGTTLRPAETRKTAGRKVVPSSGLPESLPGDIGSPFQGTGTQTKENKTKNLSLAGRLRAAGVSEAEEREIIEWISKTRPDVRSPRAYLRTLAGNGDLADLVAEWREAREAAARTQTHVSVLPPLPPWCGGCGGGNPHARINVIFRTGSGFPDGVPCPRCNPNAPDFTPALQPRQEEPA